VTTGFEPKAILPVLRVTDMDRSIGFYAGLLGFHVVWRNANDGGGENALLAWKRIELMLSTGSHLGDTPALTGTLYFNGSGVAALFERVRPHATVVWPLSAMAYGTREFGVRDPDGYTLAFAEELP
jgi:catechol 2,3-dioxygenase-like lactoylglutathione lyase family enzyme